MEKKIQKKQQEITKAQDDRARRKIVYDALTVIIEGQRNTVRELEKKAEIAMRDFVDADNLIKNLMDEISILSDAVERKENDG